MPLFRGTGGSGESSTDAYASEIAQEARTASSKANEAATSAASALAAQAAAEAAQAAAEAAQVNAETAETNAETAETNAETAEAASVAAQTSAESAKTSSETAQSAAEVAKTAAELAETNAETAETNAAASATAAASSATSAAGSATTATAQATTATAQASAASTSASNAATSESNASTSATNAATSETNASTSETNAATSATSAATSATNAASSATSASGSATTATTQASAASTSATNAATSESNASTSETNAASSASSASTSATNAATSATAAQTAQTAAEAAQTAAEAAQEAIDGFFLGAQASNPTVDLNGNAVTAGDWYFNTTDSTTRIYDGSAWNTVNPDLIGDTTPQLGGDLDLNSNDITGTGNVNITGNVVLTGTVDGRDVATDGTKLDGIEASATADQTAAEIRTLVDSATDSNVFTDADHTKLDGIEASADVTDTANVTAAGALMDSEVTNLAQVKAFDSADYATAAQGSTADSALQNVVEDTTPQLGGNLDLNGNDITGTGNINITGDTTLTGNKSVKLPRDGAGFVDRGIKFHDTLGGTEILADSSDNLTIKSVGHVVVNANDGEIKIKDGGSAFAGQIDLANDNNVTVSALIANKDIIFKGNDHDGISGVSITALTLDMSDAGKALFNAGADFGADISVTGTVAATNVTSNGNNVLTTSSTIDGGTY
jgi:hypothetical protein